MTISPTYPKFIATATLIILTSLFYYTFTSNDLAVGFLSDDAVYLLQAELYSPWHSEKAPVLNLIREESRFPPLYPLSMALLGINTDTPILASNLTVGFLLLSIFISGFWIWRETGSLVLATTTSALFAFLPGTLILAQGLWSEFLFMCLFYAAFACLAAKPLTDKHWLFSALLIALASLTRSIGITIVAGFVLLLLLRRPKKCLLYMSISLTPFLFWTFIRSISTEHSGYLNDLLLLLGNATITQFTQTIQDKVVVLSQSWLWLLSGVGSDIHYKYAGIFIATVLFVFALIGFSLRIKQWKADALCVPIYLTAILLWPYTGIYFVSRFLFPVLPLFLFYSWSGISNAVNKTEQQKLLLAAWLFSIMLIAFPSTTQMINRGYTNIDAALNPYRRDRAWLLAETDIQAFELVKKNKHIIETLPQLEKYVSEQECIYALQTPMVMLYGKRITYVFPSTATSTEESLSDTDLCRFYLAMPATDIDNSYPPYYPLAYATNNERFEIIPFYPDRHEESEPVFFLVKRIIP